MLPAAVLQDRCRPDTSSYGVCVGVGIERQRRRVLQIVGAEPDTGEHRLDTGEVLRPPVMAGADECQQPVLELEPRGHHGSRLQRLERRARVHHDVGIADRPRDGAVGAERDDDAVVDALHDAAAFGHGDRHERVGDHRRAFLIFVHRLKTR